MKKVRPTRCSAQQNSRTERAFRGPQRSEEMYLKVFWWYSRSLPTRFSISWFETHNCVVCGKLHRDGQSGTGKNESYSTSSEKHDKGKKNWYISLNGTPIRLPRSSHNDEPSPPRIWRRATWTNPTQGGIRLFLPVPHSGSGMNINGRAHYLRICGCNIFYSWFLSAAINGVCVNGTPSHVTFSRICTHVQQIRTWHWLKFLVRVMSSMFHVFVCLTSLRPTTCPSSQSLAPFYWILLIFFSTFYVGRLGEVLRALSRMRSLILWSTMPSYIFEEFARCCVESLIFLPEALDRLCACCKESS